LRLLGLLYRIIGDFFSYIGDIGDIGDTPTPAVGVPKTLLWRFTSGSGSGRY